MIKIINTYSSIVVGIDFGTTNSLVSYAHNNEIKFVQFPAGDMIESIIGYNKDGSKCFGGSAIGCDYVFKYIKRIFTDPNEATEYENYVEKINGIPYFNVNDLKKSCIDIAGDLFLYLRHQTNKELNNNIRNCVICVPSRYNEIQKQWVTEAAIQSGWKVMKIITEPTAALFALDKNEIKEDAVYGIYDWGGGTFDFSVIKFKDDVYKVLASVGDLKLGGEYYYRSWLDFFKKKYGMDCSFDEIRELFENYYNIDKIKALYKFYNKETNYFDHSKLDDKSLMTLSCIIYLYIGSVASKNYWLTLSSHYQIPRITSELNLTVEEFQSFISSMISDLFERINDDNLDTNNMLIRAFLYDLRCMQCCVKNNVFDLTIFYKIRYNKDISCNEIDGLFNRLINQYPEFICKFDRILSFKDYNLSIIHDFLLNFHQYSDAYDDSFPKHGGKPIDTYWPDHSKEPNYIWPGYYIDKAMDLISELLEKYEIKLDYLVCVGGMFDMVEYWYTNLYFLNSYLKNTLKLNPDECKMMIYDQPQIAVAKGVGNYATHLFQNENPYLLIDVTPLSIGIEVANGIIEWVILKNSALPTKGVIEFTNSNAKQTHIVFNVVQGDGQSIETAYSIGKFEIEIHPKPVFSYQIEIQLILNNNGMLMIEATNKNTNQIYKINFHSGKGLTSTMVNRLLEHKAEYAKNQEFYQTCKEIDSLLSILYDYDIQEYLARRQSIKEHEEAFKLLNDINIKFQGHFDRELKTFIQSKYDELKKK